MSGDVGKQMSKILNEFEVELKDVSNKAVEETAKAIAKDLRATSPKGKNGYAKGWNAKNRGKTSFDTEWVVFNKGHAGLTHLLEHGHDIFINGESIGKRTRPIPHIASAEQRGIDLLLKKVSKL